MGNKAFIVGCGDIGCRVGALEQTLGHDVVALARSESAQARLAERGFEIVRGDLDATIPWTPAPIAPSILYYFAPPPAAGPDDGRVARFLDSLNPANFPKRCIYISTSGVYGDCGGDWVSEDRPTNPQSERACRRLAAESRFQDWCRPRGIELVILRVPGIYGPGRLPIERIRNRVPVVREEESPFSNRIHGDDLASICIAAARSERARGIYNVSDGHPTTMTDYFYRVADLLGLPRPPAISMDQARRVLSPGMLSFLDESKRLDNRRMLADLTVQLRFPDLSAGLPACFGD